MQIGDMNLCDFCFSPLDENGVCDKCNSDSQNDYGEVGLLLPGTNLLGKYIIGKALGRGGFGATYVAYSADLKKAVAVKEYFPINISYRTKGEEELKVISKEKLELFEQGANRFFEEAKTIAMFNSNPNIVSVYEFFHANGTVYYSMEYLKGTDLKKYIARKGGRLGEAETVEITLQLCNALNEIHNARVLHRDITPDNIFICDDGCVKLIDFGASKQVLSDLQAGFSAVLKQGFAPIEQYTKNGVQGVGTDIYALGATIYYMLTGTVPPDAVDREKNPEIQLNFNSVNSQFFVALISGCMRPNLEERYQSVLDLMDYLYSIRETFMLPDVSHNNILNYSNHQNGKQPKAKQKMSLPVFIISFGVAICIALISGIVWVINSIEQTDVPVIDDTSMVETQVSDDYLPGNVESVSNEETPKQPDNSSKQSGSSSNKGTANPPKVKPAEAKPAETKPAEQTPIIVRPAETKPAEAKPAETKPAETKPAGSKQVETKPAETKPAETKPAETKPAETKPSETKPADTKPAETKPAETNPVETKPAREDRNQSKEK